MRTVPFGGRRSIRRVVNPMEEFQSPKIEFISLTENIDTSTPYGNLLIILAPSDGFGARTRKDSRKVTASILELVRRRDGTSG